jgi:hypothetical protein
MALRVKNFGEALKDKTFTCRDEVLYIHSTHEDSFWIDNDGKYNSTEKYRDSKPNVILVTISWEEHKMTIDIVAQGHGKNAWVSHSAPINKDVMVSLNSFLYYLTLCIGQSEIWSNYNTDSKLV